MVNPGRDEGFKPDQVVAALKLNSGQVVADIGSGPGYFALRFARAVESTGRVYGVDIEPHFLAELERLAGASGLSNVVPILTGPDDSGLPPASCDLVFFCSTYLHLKDRVAYLKRLRSRLKPGGRIAIVDWKKVPSVEREDGSSRWLGPDERFKLERDQVIGELQEARYMVLEQLDFLEYHFFVIAGLER